MGDVNVLNEFQSTLSVRRATKDFIDKTLNQVFQSTLSVRRATMYMVSLPPDMIFQSTLSVRRATKLYAIVKYSKNISIHALRKESDETIIRQKVTLCIFQSTLSVRRATQWIVTLVDLAQFQSTLSVRRATCWFPAVSTGLPIFQSTLSVRRATIGFRPYCNTVTISIHALRKESDRRSRRTVTQRKYFNPRSP